MSYLYYYIKIMDSRLKILQDNVVKLIKKMGNDSSRQHATLFLQIHVNKKENFLFSQLGFTETKETKEIAHFLKLKINGLTDEMLDQLNFSIDVHL